MKVEGPSLAPWVSAWLDDDLRRVTQFALTTSEHNGTPDASPDRPGTVSHPTGVGRRPWPVTWSRSVARKVTRFVDELHRLFHDPKPLSDLEIRNVDTNLRSQAAGPPRSAEVPVVTADEFESPDKLLRRIYDEDFGFLPTNCVDEAGPRGECHLPAARRFHHRLHPASLASCVST